jgi:hypothetical protein
MPYIPMLPATNQWKSSGFLASRQMNSSDELCGIVPYNEQLQPP